MEKAFKQAVWRKGNGSSQEIINDIYSFYPVLISLIFNKLYFKIIAELIGSEVVWLPECSIHRNRYVAWHKDTTEQELGGVKSHYCTDLMLQVAVYFQENNPECGGGLTVLPGSHRVHDRYLAMFSKNPLHRVVSKWQKLMGWSPFHHTEKTGKAVAIQSVPGDLVVFDLRLDHCSTPAFKPRKMDKLAIFNTFGNPSIALREYLEFMKNRPEPYYRFLRKYRCPAELHRIAQANEITIWE